MKFLPYAILLLSGALNLHAAVTTLLPTADAQVRRTLDTGGSRATTNYGTDPTFAANNGNGVRVTFLRFDLSSIDTSTITSIKLDLTTQSTGADSFNVYGLISGESWIESGTGGITWNNAPGVNTGFAPTSSPASYGGTLSQFMDTSALYGGGIVLSTFTAPNVGNTLNTAIDASSGEVFNFINADADKFITFVIAEQDGTGPDVSGVTWHSKEATNANFRPQLTITTVPEPSVVALGGLGLLALFRRRRQS